MYRSAPKNPAPYDHTQYAISDASYRRPLSSGSAENAKALRAIGQWQNRGMNMGLRQYEMIGLRNPNTFMPLVYFMADQFSHARKHQLTSYTSEITPFGFPDNYSPEEQHWNGNRMNVYAGRERCGIARLPVRNWCATGPRMPTIVPPLRWKNITLRWRPPGARHRSRSATTSTTQAPRLPGSFLRS